MNKKRVLNEYLRGSRGAYLTALAVMIAVTLLSLAIPVIVGGVLDKVISRNIRGNALWLPAATVILLYLTSYLFQYAQNVLTSVCAANIGRNLRLRLIKHILCLPLPAFDRFHTGDLLQRSSADVEEAQAFYTQQAVAFLHSVLLLTVALVMSLRISLLITLIYIPLSAIIFLISFGTLGRYLRGFEKQEELWSTMNAVAQESLSANTIVRIFGRIDTETERFAGACDAALDCNLLNVRSANRTTGIQESLCQLQAAVILIAGIALIVRGNMTIGDLTVLISYSTMILDSIRQFAYLLNVQVSRSFVGFRRIDEVLDTPTEDMKAGLPLPDGDVDIHDLVFSYDGRREILKGISMRVERGGRVGILGTTGSGKSTLLKLLTGCYPVPAGSIRIGGVDIGAVSKSSLRREMSLIPQEAFLFAGTVGENLSLSGHAAEADMRKACRTACAEEFIDTRGQGLETEVSAAGRNFSGGERQRVAIARSLTKKPRVLLIDDALSALDAQTACTVQSRLADSRKDTTVVVSHRVSALKDCDVIYVMEGGRITQSGTHEQLVARPGLYRNICNLQTEIEGS